MQEVDFLRYIVESLVFNKEAIIIERVEDSLGVLLTLKVAKEDMWIIIWKSGNNINSLRIVLRTLWAKIWKKVNLKVLD